MAAQEREATGTCTIMRMSIWTIQCLDRESISLPALTIGHAGTVRRCTQELPRPTLKCPRHLLSERSWRGAFASFAGANGGTVLGPWDDLARKQLLGEKLYVGPQPTFGSDQRQTAQRWGRHKILKFWEAADNFSPSLNCLQELVPTHSITQDEAQGQFTN